MTWNILFGGEDRFERILALLRETRPDVLVLQECLGFDEGDRLARVAEAIDVDDDDDHVYLGLARARPSGRRFHVALLSRFPIVSKETHADPAHVGHALVEADLDVGGDRVVVVGAHFDSHDEDSRVRDAKTLCTIVDRQEVARARVLVAGDLNALTHRDPYPDLAAKLRAAGVDKYGHPPRFDTMERLDRHGFVDLLHHRQQPASWITAVRDRGGVRIDYRTDYLLASPLLAASAVATRVLHCNGASDHEPVLTEFRSHDT